MRRLRNQNEPTSQEIQTYHLVDSLNNSQHFLVTDLSITIDIIELECPIEFILHLATAGHAERANELLEVDSAALIRVEDFEDVVGKGTRITKREELPIDFLEFLLGQGTRRAIFQKSYSCSVASTKPKTVYFGSYLCTIAVTLSYQSVSTSGGLLIAGASTWTVWKKC